MSLASGLKHKAKTDVIAGAIPAIAKGLARKPIAHVVHKVAADRPGMAGSQTDGMAPRDGVNGVGEVLGIKRISRVIFDRIQADEYVLIVGRNKVKPGVMRVQSNRDRRIEAEPTRVQSVTCRCRVRRILGGGSGQSGQRGRVNARRWIN